MSSFSESVLQDKLARLTSSQDSIETLSSWIIHHRTHASTSVTKWLQNIVHSDKDKKILLLYLANDILQNSRRKSLTSFQELFKEPLKHAASLVSSPKNRQAFIKIISLWRERRIYDAIYLNELENYIEPVQQVSKEPKPKQTVAMGDFKLSLLEDSLTELQKFEGEMKVKAHALSRLTIDVSSMSSLSQLKDKSSGGKFEAEFENASKKLLDYYECLGIEVEERKNLVSMLEQCKHYQDEKNEELKSLLKDYENIKKHFEDVQEKLKEKVEQLEKAKHTATSDPTSQEDIIVAGDMEIDSDGEEDVNQSSNIPLPLPLNVPVPQPQGVLVQPPSGGVPSFQSGGVPSFHPRGAVPPISQSVRPPPIPSPHQTLLPSPLRPPPQPSFPHTYHNNGMSPYATIPPPPPVTLPLPPPTQSSSFTPPVPYSPSMPKVFTPRLPLNSPPQSTPTHSFYTPIKNIIEQSKVILQSVTDKFPDGGSIRAPSPTGTAPSNNQMKPLTPVISDTIVLKSQTTPGNLVRTPSDPNVEARPKDSNKMLPLSLFQDYSDSDSEDEMTSPYSPSGDPPTAMATTTTGSVQDEEKESIPTPNMTPPTPDYVTFSTNHSLNIGNSMLATTTTTNDVNPSQSETKTTVTINHYKSASPPMIPDSKETTPTVTEETKASSTSAGPNPITNSQSFSQAIMNLASSINPHLTATQPPSSSNTVKPENIKITPTFTNLLDKLFPQLSQSLQSERKRKQYPNDDTSVNKAPHTDEHDDDSSSNVIHQQPSHMDTSTITNHATIGEAKPSDIEPSDDITRYEMEIQDIANNTPAPPVPPPPLSSVAPPNIMSQLPPPNSYQPHPSPQIHSYRPQSIGGPRLFPTDLPPQRPSLSHPPLYGPHPPPLPPPPGFYHSRNAAPLRPRYY